jgi:hypothetical protein
LQKGCNEEKRRCRGCDSCETGMFQTRVRTFKSPMLLKNLKPKYDAQFCFKHTAVNQNYSYHKM